MSLLQVGRLRATGGDAGIANLVRAAMIEVVSHPLADVTAGWSA